MRFRNLLATLLCIPYFSASFARAQTLSQTQSQRCASQALTKKSDLLEQASAVRSQLDTEIKGVRSTGHPSGDLYLAAIYLVALNQGIGRSKKVEFMLSRIENGLSLSTSQRKALETLCHNGWDVWQYVTK